MKRAPYRRRRVTRGCAGWNGSPPRPQIFGRRVEFSSGRWWSGAQQGLNVPTHLALVRGLRGVALPQPPPPGGKARGGPSGVEIAGQGGPNAKRTQPGRDKRRAVRQTTPDHPASRGYSPKEQRSALEGKGRRGSSGSCEIYREDYQLLARPPLDPRLDPL
eukprot:1191541-Prorocentrum_minimum.AAC.3